MKYLSGYTDPFLSPVSGLLATEQPLPDLERGYVWVGDKNNRPIPSFKLIDLTIDVRFLQQQVEAISEASVVLNEPMAVFPNAQALSDLNDGLMKNKGGVVQIAIPGTDYLDLVNEAYADGIIPVVLRDKVISRSKLQIVNIDGDHDNISGINTLTCRDVLATVQQGAGGSVRADQQLLSLNTVEGRQLILYDYNPAHRYTQYVSLKAPASVAVNINWVMPDTVSTTGQVLTDIGNAPLSTDRQLAFRNMPSVDATYILKQPHNTLPNAQALNQLVGVEPKILKAAADGTIEIAIRDQDYATKETLEQLKTETEEFKNQAATSAEEAAASAEEATASATEATTAAGEATAAAAEATGAAVEASASAGAAGVSALAAAGSALAAAASAGSASSSASDAASSASHAHTSETNAANSATSAQNSLNTLLNTGIILQGAIHGAGPLLSPITTYFQDNPVLPGNASMILPKGVSSQRPTVPIAGMFRYNTAPN